MRKSICAALVLIASTATANATPFSGSYTISSTSNPTITNLLANSFILDLTVGTPQTFSLVNIFENSDGSSAITATFNFTSPVMGSGAALAADVFSTPGNSKHDSFTGGATSVVNFSDGAVLDIKLGSASYDGSSGNYDGLIAPVTFSLIAAPTNAIPEPLTISLLGAGFAGIVALRRRKMLA
jgi:hypothetical protein